MIVTVIVTVAVAVTEFFSVTATVTITETVGILVTGGSQYMRSFLEEYRYPPSSPAAVDEL